MEPGKICWSNNNLHEGTRKRDVLKGEERLGGGGLGTGAGEEKEKEG